MELKILKNEMNELKLEIVGETHTFCNLLQNLLLEDESVEMAGYTIPHPLTASPILYIRTKKEKPITALKRAVKKIKKINEDFASAYERALKEFH